MALLGRNDCFGGGRVEIPSHKIVIIFFIFLHVGNCFLWNCTFKICSTKINCKNHVKSHYNVCCFAILDNIKKTFRRYLYNTSTYEIQATS